MDGLKFKCKMQQPNWIFAFASVLGNSHISEEIPCQDFCEVKNFEHFSLAVVCDGAGSCVNSQIGAQRVTEYCIRYFEELLIEQKWDIQDELPSEQEWQACAKKTLKLVNRDLERYSMSNEDMDFKSLSCTVIVTIALPNGLLVTHIGDGRAGYCNTQNEWFSTITPFHGELANQTVFVTSDIWDDDIIDMYIESRVIKDNIKAFCLLSDGCERASFECNLLQPDSQTYYDPNRPYPLFFNPNVKVLIELNKQNKNQHEINLLWESFLKYGNDKLKTEPDDKTLILGVKLIDEDLIESAHVNISTT